MKPAKGYYSLIQYCPDFSRLEAANIGVLLFSAEIPFLQALTAKSNQRIIRFFGSEGHDWAQVNLMKQSIEERIQVESKNIKTLAGLETFIARRANLIQISPPRPMRVTYPPRDLEMLYKELIGGKHRGEKGTSLRQYLGEEFTRAGLQNKIKRDIPVAIPLLNRNIEVPYGFQNGYLNLIQPAGFKAAKVAQIEASACKLAIEGKSLWENEDPNLGKMRLVVVGDFGSHQAEKKALVQRIFGAYEVGLFTATHLGPLIDLIRSTGKDQPADGQGK